jgi:hypothetical protein
VKVLAIVGIHVVMAAHAMMKCMISDVFVHMDTLDGAANSVSLLSQIASLYSIIILMSSVTFEHVKCNLYKAFIFLILCITI